ncbi:hypothetical protein JTB14_007471 [Gonioctena quinquepunctata]|nr:hypothetical protein JTB14_007471 [Gonioctena quinquepunctata]
MQTPKRKRIDLSPDTTEYDTDIEIENTERSIDAIIKQMQREGPKILLEKKLRETKTMETQVTEKDIQQQWESGNFRKRKEIQRTPDAVE